MDPKYKEPIQSEVSISPSLQQDHMCSL